LCPKHLDERFPPEATFALPRPATYSVKLIHAGNVPPNLVKRDAQVFMSVLGTERNFGRFKVLDNEYIDAATKPRDKRRACTAAVLQLYSLAGASQKQLDRVQLTGRAGAPAHHVAPSAVLDLCGPVGAVIVMIGNPLEMRVHGGDIQQWATKNCVDVIWNEGIQEPAGAWEHAILYVVATLLTKRCSTTQAFDGVMSAPFLANSGAMQWHVALGRDKDDTSLPISSGADLPVPMAVVDDIGDAKRSSAAAAEVRVCDLHTM
jgi:hypothetical protein